MTFNSPNPATYNLLMTRRSVKTRDMTSPGPDQNAIEQILAAGMRVPDHGKLGPWRFIVLRDQSQEKLGDLIAAMLVSENETRPEIAQKMKGYATQAPVLIIAISSPKNDSPIPLWEQELSAGAACQNMLVAATALGYAGQWLTGWAAYSPGVQASLGLQADEKIAGFLFFGSHDRTPSERPRPEAGNHITWGWPEAGQS